MRLVDAHCDTITVLARREKELLDNDCHISLNKLSAFDSPVIFFAVYLSKERIPNLFETFEKVYKFLLSQVVKNKDKVSLAKSYSDILSNIENKKVSAVPAIEEGGILEGKMENFHRVVELGVKYITLTWNYVNEIGEPSALNGAGLTPFGKELVREMNKTGVLVDVSHLSEKGFWDVYNISEKPFIASHSDCKAIFDCHRNLTDDQLKAIGEKGGCVGVNIYPAFLNGEKTATIDDVCRHIDHMLKFAGENSTGIGTDFDGIGSTPEGLEDISKLPSLYNVCETRYGKELTEKIFFENFMRVLSK